MTHIKGLSQVPTLKGAAKQGITIGFKLRRETETSHGIVVEYAGERANEDSPTPWVSPEYAKTFKVWEDAAVVASGQPFQAPPCQIERVNRPIQIEGLGL